MKISQLACYALLSAALLNGTVSSIAKAQSVTDLGGVTTDLGGVTTDLGGADTDNGGTNTSDGLVQAQAQDLANKMNDAIADCGGSVCADMLPLIQEARAMVSEQAQ